MSGVRDRFEYLCLVWLTGGPAILHEKLSGSLSLRMLHSTAGSAVLQGCTYSLPFFTPDIVAWRTQIIKESLSNQLIQLLNGRGVVKRMRSALQISCHFVTRPGSFLILAYQLFRGVKFYFYHSIDNRLLRKKLYYSSN